MGVLELGCLGSNPRIMPDWMCDLWKVTYSKNCFSVNCEYYHTLPNVVIIIRNKLDDMYKKSIVSCSLYGYYYNIQ